MSTIDFHSNVNEIINLKDGAVERALEAIGIQAEGYAKMKCPVDTGRLRNSITHAQEGDDTEILGTNVEYAPYVEFGHRSPGGRHVPGQPYFEPAVQDHIPEYKRIVEEYLKNT